MPDKSKKIFNTRTEFIDNEVMNLENKVKQIQRDLLEIMLTDYVVNFKSEGGNLLFSDENLLLLFELESIWNELQTIEEPLQLKFASDLLKLTEYSVDYFTELGLKVSGIKNKITTLYEVIGISDKGKIIEGGNLSKIFKTSTSEFQLQIQNYILDSVTSNKSYADFVKGFKEQITGTEQIDGKLIKYYRQYTTDLMSKVARITDNFYASELGLNYFVYDGDLIGTSREFCIEKAGLVFTPEQAEEWKKEDWAGKYPKGNEYNPLVDMGGANCRHLARWITDEMAADLMKDQDAIIEQNQKNVEKLKQDKKK